MYYMTSNYTELYHTVAKENDSIDKTVKYMEETYSTDNQKVLYTNKQVEWIQLLNIYLIVFYFILFITLSILLFKNNKHSNLKKGIFILLFLLFPFVIISIELFFYNIYNYIVSFLLLKMYPSNAFT